MSRKLDHSSIDFVIIFRDATAEGTTVRSDHTAAVNRAEEILCESVDDALHLEAEPSLVVAYFLVAVLCDDKHSFVAENQRMKWNIRLLARHLGFSEVLARNAVKSCSNANLYDSRGFLCYSPSRLRDLKTPRLVALRAALLEKLKKQRSPVQLLPFETSELSSDQKETLRQFLLLDHQARLFVRDVLQGRQRQSSPEVKKLLKPFAAWRSSGLEIAARFLV